MWNQSYNLLLWTAEWGKAMVSRFPMSSYLDFSHVLFTTSKILNEKGKEKIQDLLMDHLPSLVSKILLYRHIQRIWARILHSLVKSSCEVSKRRRSINALCYQKWGSMEVHFRLLLMLDKFLISFVLFHKTKKKKNMAGLVFVIY